MSPREYTTDEVRELFLDHVRQMVLYWERESRPKTTRERLEGLAHSLLVLLDGGTVLPGFIVAPRPHKDDKAFCKSDGENWFPEAPDVPSDIGGCLHELFYHKPRP